jgi:hypothetical protein
MAKKKAEPTDDFGTSDWYVVVDGLDGHKHYAWRKDGVKPVIDLVDFARNIHSALKGNPGADFADRVGPQ